MELTCNCNKTAFVKTKHPSSVFWLLFTSCLISVSCEVLLPYIVKDALRHGRKISSRTFYTVFLLLWSVVALFVCRWVKLKTEIGSINGMVDLFFLFQFLGWLHTMMDRIFSLFSGETIAHGG